MRKRFMEITEFVPRLAHRCLHYRKGAGVEPLLVVGVSILCHVI
jgi:hypothetical protein